VNKSLLDTDILSEISKGIDPNVARNATAYRTAFGRYTLSVITIMEVVRGFQKKQSAGRLQRFLTAIASEEILPFDQPAAELGRREALQEMIGYMSKRLDRMRYGQWLEQDLVIAMGQVEGTVRHLVGERFDCAGMRWRQDKAEPLLHLRCIELNGDWEHFFAWTQKHTARRLRQGKRVKLLTDQPLTLDNAA
jgi:hypothetical protein